MRNELTNEIAITNANPDTPICAIPLLAELNKLPNDDSDSTVSEGLIISDRGYRGSNSILLARAYPERYFEKDDFLTPKRWSGIKLLGISGLFPLISITAF